MPAGTGAVAQYEVQCGLQLQGMVAEMLADQVGILADFIRATITGILAE